MNGGIQAWLYWSKQPLLEITSLLSLLKPTKLHCCIWHTKKHLVILWQKKTCAPVNDIIHLCGVWCTTVNWCSLGRVYDCKCDGCSRHCTSSHYPHNKWRILESYFMFIPQQPYWPMEEAPPAIKVLYSKGDHNALNITSLIGAQINLSRE